MAIGETPALLNLRMPSPANGNSAIIENQHKPNGHPGGVRSAGSNALIAGDNIRNASFGQSATPHTNGSITSKNPSYNTVIRHGFEQQYESEQYMNLLAEVCSLQRSKG